MSWFTKKLVAVAAVVASTVVPLLRHPPIPDPLPFGPLLPIATRAATGGASRPFDPDRPSVELSAMTYNIWGKEHKDAAGRRELEAIGEIVRAKSPDVVSLNEVWSRPGFDQAAIIAAVAGDYRVIHGPALHRVDGTWDYGVALLVRRGGPLDLQVANVENHPHPRGAGVDPSKDEQRTALVADLVARDGRTFRVIATHLSLDERSRQAQAERLVELSKGQPTLVLGDLNARPSSRNVRTLRENGFTDAWRDAHDWKLGNTHGGGVTGKRIDYALVTEGTARSASVEKSPEDLSDHNALVTKVEINTKGLAGALK